MRVGASLSVGVAVVAMMVGAWVLAWAAGQAWDWVSEMAWGIVLVPA
jgi:hypothetical protein